jgi:hypothetical protein
MKLASMVVLTGLAFITVPAWPQTGVVAGKVIDRATKEPIPFANVYLRGSYRATSADSLGRFRLVVPANKQEVIVFSHVAYKKETYDLRVEEGKDMEVTVELEPRSIGMSDVTVTAPRLPEERMATKVITEKDIEQRAPQRLSDVLRWLVPQVQYRSSLSAIRGRPDYVVYWNGLRLSSDVDLDFIDPYVIEKIIVWRSNYAPLYYDVRGARYVIDIKTK